MDEAQAARAATRHDQRTLVIALTVADPAQKIVHTHTLTFSLKKSVGVLKKVAPDGRLVPVESHSS